MQSAGLSLKNIYPQKQIIKEVYKTEEQGIRSSCWKNAVLGTKAMKKSKLLSCITELGGFRWGGGGGMGRLGWGWGWGWGGGRENTRGEWESHRVQGGHWPRDSPACRQTGSLETWVMVMGIPIGVNPPPLLVLCVGWTIGSSYFHFCDFRKWAHCCQLSIFLWVQFQKIAKLRLRREGARQSFWFQ